MRLITLCLLFMACAVLVGCDDDAEDGATLEAWDEGRVDSVAGGEPTKWAEEWRGVVGLGAAGMTMCTGTLIDPQVVLTAGHCVKYGGPFDLSAMPNLLSIVGGAEAGRTLARGQKIVIHPTWEGSLDQGATDLALIKLNKQVTEVPHYRLRDFPLPQAGDPAFLVGYGSTESGGGGTQYMGDTALLSVTPNLLETGGPGTANSCPGDSGGPVFTKQNDEWVLNGVVSFGPGTECTAELNSYSVNTLSSCHWLNKKMIDLVGHDLGLESCSLCDLSPVGIWGRGCGPDLPSCPLGTTCMKPPDFSDGQYGFCSAPCCDVSEDDKENCFDVAGGDESCGLRSASGENFCVIHCEDDSDCPNFTVCKQKPFEEERICIATADTGGGEFDTDTDTLYYPDDTDSSSDADTDGDSDTGGDSGTEESGDEDAGEGDDTAGCGCRTVSNLSRGSVLSLLKFALTSIVF